MMLAVSSSLRELVAGLLGLHELRRQVVAGIAAAHLEQLLEIHPGHRVARIGLRDLLRRQRHRIENASAVARPLVEDLAVLLGNAEHVADDGDRQAESEILDQVHVALLDDGVDGLVDDRLDAGPHVLDAARGEGLHHESAQAGMIRRILLQHPVAHAAEDRLVHDLGTVAANRAIDIVLAETLVAHHEAHFGMTACHIRAMDAEMNRVRSPHPRIMRIGIADELRRQRIEQRLGCGGLHMLVHGTSLGPSL